MSRRSRGQQGDLFGDAEPQDALPELDDLLHTHGPRTSGRPNSTARAASAYLFRPRRANPGVRRALVWLRVVIYSLLFGFSLFGVGVGLESAVSGYSDAGNFASAPACAAGVDPTNTTVDCVATLSMVTDFGVYNDGSEDSIALNLPPAGSQALASVSFPSNAEFENAVGDGPSVVRAEYWRGQIVTLTAGTEGVTVTTDQNPNNMAGNGLGVAFISLTFVLFSILLFIGIREFRLRWLRPGLVLRLTVSGLVVWTIGFLVAGCCLVAQPAWVLRVGVIAPIVTVVLTAALWLALYSGRRGRLGRGYRFR